MDFEDIDEELRQLAADRARRDKLQRDRASIRSEIDGAEKRRNRWQEMAAAAGEDLQKLEGLSLTALFRSILGDRGDRIRDEQAKLLHAKLRHDEAEAALAPLLAEDSRIRQELKALGDIDQRNRELLGAKEALVRTRGGEQAERLDRVGAQIGGLQSAVREIDEAIDAAFAAEEALDSAADSLRSAKSWGTFDLLGGGLVATYAKHSNIDKARLWAERAQQRLRRFARELEDVAASSKELTVDVGDFLRFSDYFFDGLIADWMVQRRIVEATERVTATRSQVRRLRLDLERRKKGTGQQLDEAQRQRATWIAES